MFGRKVVHLLGLLPLVTGTILMNGQEKITNYPNTKIDLAASSFTSYVANASEISYQAGQMGFQACLMVVVRLVQAFKGLSLDANSIPSAPGLKFGFTGNTVAITFGDWTSDGVLVGYRIGGMDWAFTNVTAGGTHLFITKDTPAISETWPYNAAYNNPLPFELRVTNWAYGVQIDQVHVAKGEKLIKLAAPSRRIEVIGDSLASGMYTSYEGLSSWGYALGAGLGDTEYSITAYPGICAADQDCWGNPRGQMHQWFYTSDTSYRASVMYGDKPEPWPFCKHAAPDIVVINIGTNDQNKANNVSTARYISALTALIQGVHGKYPKAQVVVMSLWLGFYQAGNSYFASASHGFEKEIYQMTEYFNSPAYLDAPVVWDAVKNKTTTLQTKSEPFLHYFNTTGILQHNDIGPQWHPTDVGAIKVASHLIQYIRLKFGWELRATGPEVLHDTLYWNDQQFY